MSTSAAALRPQPQRFAIDARVVTALTLTLIMWASAFVVIRSVGRHLSPGPLALTRLMVGSVALSAVMLARRQPLPSRRALPGSLLAGLLWMGAYTLSLNAAERWVDPGTSSLLVNTGPIFIALLAGALLGEGFPRALLSGCAIAFLGAALIALGLSGHGTHELLGAGLCVVAAVCYAAGVVAQKPALRHASALQVTWLACLTGAVAMLAYLPETLHQLAHSSAATVVGAVYLGVGPTATGFVLWAYALARTDAGKLGSTTYLVPPLVVLIGWITLGEVPPLLALPGGLLCLAGVAVARGGLAKLRRRA
ncbi:MAG TPA: DMT family transporter [Solirubrobacteraceae bacterium]|nr:DMT family transporter [Solirubrobacteraceae bacterium]